MNAIEGMPIVCFGSERWEYPGFQQRVMRALSDRNAVTFVNPIGVRSLSWSPANLAVYLRKAATSIQGATTADPHATVVNPRIVPLVYSPAAMALNALLLRRQLRAAIDESRRRDTLLWIGTPTAAPFIHLFRPRLAVYNPVDRYQSFSFANKEGILRYSARAAASCDLAICTSDAIHADVAPHSRRAVVVPHAVDFAHFNAALQRNTRPADLPDDGTPVIGYVGALSDWVDFDLIAATARAFPNCHVVLVGPTVRAMDALQSLPNLRWLGRKPFAEIPDYVRWFDVALIPFLVNDLTVGVDPIKLREYLCTGRPCVCTPLPEIEKLRDLVYLAPTASDFIAQVGRALAEKDPEPVEARIQNARAADWPIRINEIRDILNRSLSEKREGGH
jgi:glycosyltransferase involved in cell wall biosynthesis